MTTENNKIIAEFISNENSYHKGHYICQNGIATLPKDMKFHLDWNWLMEVVEKIYSLSGENKPYYGITFTMHNDTFQFGTDNQNEVGLNKHISSQKNNLTRINVVYNACLEFIKWYNEQENK